jgi:hypothetical protein
MLDKVKRNNRKSILTIRADPAVRPRLSCTRINHILTPQVNNHHEVVSQRLHSHHGLLPHPHRSCRSRCLRRLPSWLLRCRHGMLLSRWLHLGRDHGRQRSCHHHRMQHRVRIVSGCLCGCTSCAYSIGAWSQHDVKLKGNDFIVVVEEE